MKIGLCAVSRTILQLLVFIGICHSLYSKCSRISSRSHVRCSNTVLHSIVPQVQQSEDDTDPDDPNNLGFENQPEWLSLFPKKRDKPEMVREYPDFSLLEPNDPLFLDMPWPTESGPEASAFSRHMHWRRGLSDGESKYKIYKSVRESVGLLFELTIFIR